MRKIKAVFFDIDGTLTEHGEGPFKDDVEAMEETSSLGHLLYINTGRSLANIPVQILDLPFWNGIVAGGGTHALLKESSGKYKTIYHKWVDEEHLMEICAWYLKNKKQLVLEGENDCYVINPSVRKFSMSSIKIISRYDDIKNLYPLEFITKLTMEDIKTAEEKELLEKNFSVNVFPNYAEAILKTENKAKGMSFILEAVGIKREDSVALGDSVNDLEMIKYAGIGVAMGNASAELKAAAKAITANCGEGGVCQALKRFVL